MSDLEPTLDRLAELLERVTQQLAPPQPPTDWNQAIAYRWRQRNGHGWLQTVDYPDAIRLDDLLGIDRTLHLLDTNTRQFVQGLPANNALLWGSRGTGKSSLIKALLQQYADDGLRLIEVEKHHLVDLPDIVEPLQQRPERFLLFCDDLSFEANETGYKALKAVLDGSVAAAPDNVLIYATSNRRHLLPEHRADNLDTVHTSGEIHHGEAVEEKISLSERFGLWLSFHPFDQDTYLRIVEHWLDQLAPNGERKGMRAAALRWALARGSRSGRSAAQFARDWAGRHALQHQDDSQ